MLIKGLIKEKKEPINLSSVPENILTSFFFLNLILNFKWIFKKQIF